MKKLLVTGVLASTALFLLGGCGSSSAKSNAASSSEKTSDGKKTIDFWSFWGSGARKEVIEEIIDEYNQSQDKIQVNYKYQPWGGYLDQIIVSDYSGECTRRDCSRYQFSCSKS